MVDTPFDWMRVGHWTDAAAMTGCTVIRFDRDVVASGEVRGGAPATREFALLEPTRMVERVDAVVLSGGSAFGLAAADGVARALQSEGVGFATAHGTVPIVVGMSLYDLGVGDASRWPGSDDGCAALVAAGETFDTGLVGAGRGATVGNWRGQKSARPGGFGFASVSRDDLVVSALVAVNAVGDLKVEEEGATTIESIANGSFVWPESDETFGENTTIGVLVTNGSFTKTQCKLLAEAGHDGLARAIAPAHGPSDGDAMVAVAGGLVDADVSTGRLLASAAVETAIAAIRT